MSHELSFSRGGTAIGPHRQALADFAKAAKVNFLKSLKTDG